MVEDYFTQPSSPRRWGEGLIVGMSRRNVLPIRVDPFPSPRLVGGITLSYSIMRLISEIEFRLP
jgi:hypothetical protein